MKKFRLNRRDVLRGAGSIAIGLPWLEAMNPVQDAHAQDASLAQRFLAVYQPGGTVMNDWRPSGTETSPTLSRILAPLEPVKDKVLVIDGLSMKSAVGEQHQAGIIAFLTGTPQSSAHQQFAGGPSLDQVIASTASAGKPRNSIEMAIRWATGKSHGLLHPINSLTFADDSKFSPIPPRLDPADIWNSLFGTLDTGPVDENADTSAQTTAAARKASILDFVDRRYETVSQRLGQADRLKLEEHLDKVRELEAGIQALADRGENGTLSSGCAAPELVDTSGYNPASGLSADDNGAVKDVSSDELIPVVGKLMTDMMVMALACDLTAVGTLQWSDTEAKHTFPWLGLSEHHHFYQHDGGFAPEQCAKIDVWYSEQHAYLIQQLDAVDMGGHSLLDESIVFFGSELADPPTHTKDSMPFLLAGGGGGLSGGRWLKYNGQSHNDLLLSILHLFGDERDSFGAQQYSNGTLSNLT